MKLTVTEERKLKDRFQSSAASFLAQFLLEPENFSSWISSLFVNDVESVSLSGLVCVPGSNPGPFMTHHGS